jgi:hypothetical protein
LSGVYGRLSNNTCQLGPVSNCLLNITFKIAAM